MKIRWGNGTGAIRSIGFWLLCALVVASVAPAGRVLRQELRYARNHDRPGPNVILFAVDTLRADALPHYGADLATPGLDRLVERGVVFEQAHTVAPATGVSFASMMTSRYPQEHGVTTSAVELPAAETTMAEILRENGYATAAFVSAWILDGRYGLDAGFGTYDDELVSRHESRIDEKDALTVIERASRWLETNGERKFFLWMHFFEPHDPYRCWDADLGSSIELEAGRVAEIGRRLAAGGEGAQQDREVVWDCYLSEVARVDAALDGFLDVLERRGLLAETLIVFVADHGETLGDRDGYFGHIASLHREVLRIPLVVAFPGGEPAGLTVQTPVSSLDLLPTVLDVVGTESTQPTRGVSLRSVLDGSTSSRPIFAAGESLYWLEKGQAFAVRDGPWKLIEHELAPDLLYDLSTDPQETKDLRPERPDRYRHLQGLLTRWKRATGYRPSLTNPALRVLAGWKNGLERVLGLEMEPLDPRGLDDEERRQLRALGYLR